MAASYKKLFKLLIDREMKSKELAALAKVSPATIAKMKKDGATVSLISVFFPEPPSSFNALYVYSINWA